ncbi:DUF1636 family protein [Limoniibacter endophyticus]|nr:DUF1636 family protein [Limoniibacter endophyticus]
MTIEITVDVPSTEVPETDPVTVFVCTSCRNAEGSSIEPLPGQDLARATIAAGKAAGVPVRAVSCLGNCNRRLSAALMREGGWSYVFGDLRVEQAADLIAAAQLFATSPNGVLPWRGRPDSLKRGLVARIPPIDHLENFS